MPAMLSSLQTAPSTPTCYPALLAILYMLIWFTSAHWFSHANQFPIPDRDLSFHNDFLAKVWLPYLLSTEDHRNLFPTVKIRVSILYTRENETTCWLWAGRRMSRGQRAEGDRYSGKAVKCEPASTVSSHPLQVCLWACCNPRDS